MPFWFRPTIFIVSTQITFAQSHKIRIKSGNLPNEICIYLYVFAINAIQQTKTRYTHSTYGLIITNEFWSFWWLPVCLSLVLSFSSVITIQIFKCVQYSLNLINKYEKKSLWKVSRNCFNYIAWWKIIVLFYD